jgi:hypothetical protein
LKSKAEGNLPDKDDIKRSATDAKDWAKNKANEDEDSIVDKVF